MNEIMKLAEALKDLEYYDHAANSDEISFHITKENNHISLEINLKNQEECEALKAVSEFNELIDKMDDKLFAEAAARIGEKEDLKRLDDLLEKEHLTKEEAAEAARMIETASQTIGELILEKINDMVSIYKSL